jgi:hypothetical protein
MIDDVNEQQIAGPEDRSIVLEIDVPDTATDAEILEGVRALVGAVDELHRAHGGSGLQLDALEITSEAVTEEDR